MTDTDLRISAVICTRDRLPYLKLSLDSLTSQTLDRDRYEIVVVDNGSTDATAACLREARGRVPNLVCPSEQRAGLSRARNAALRAARGEYIAYLDDDAIAAPDWLEQILRAFAAAGSGVGCLGGRADPIWEAERPDWLSDEALGALAIIDWTDEAGFLEEGQYVVGANMAFSTQLLRDVGGFPEDLGRIGGSLLSGEETFVAERMAERGRATYYDPRVSVRHHVQAERLHREWFLRRAYWQGVSAARAADANPSPPLQRAVAASALLLRIARHPFQTLPFLIRGDRARAFDETCSTLRRRAELSFRLNLPWLAGRYRHGP